MIVLMTGITSGFGEEMARKFVKMGNTMIATGRRRERLDGLAVELGGAHRRKGLDREGGGFPACRI